MDSAEDKEKADKLAAARKRVEQLKKQKAGKKRDKAEGSETKKKISKASKEAKEADENEKDVEVGKAGDTKAEVTEHDAPKREQPAMEEESRGMPTVPEEESTRQHEQAPSASPPPPPVASDSPTSPTTSAAAPSHSRAASFSASRDLKQGLRRLSLSSSGTGGSARSPNPLSPGEAVLDIYRKQAQTISELTEANEKLEAELKELRGQGENLNAALAQKEELQEELAELKSTLNEYQSQSENDKQSNEEKVGEMEKMKFELATATRQVSLLTSQLSQKDKVISDLRLKSFPNSSEQDHELLRSKEEQIEAMEMEISKLRVDLDKSSKPLSDAISRSETAEENLKSAEENQASLTKQIEELKKKLDKAAERLVAESAARSSAETKLRETQTQLETQVAQIKKNEASIASWEKDHSTLKHLYKETDTLAQDAQRRLNTLELENEDLKRHIANLRERTTESRRGTGSMQADDDELDGMEADERNKLRRRVRELEALLEENRASSTTTTTGRPGHRRIASEKSGFTEVQFLGNFPTVDEDEFLPSSDDEGDTFQKLQARREEEERVRREERTREIKAGLVKWKGYRLDLTMVPGRVGLYGGLMGDMFEV